MESLVRVREGSDDIAVGISGFGSAEVGPDRWEEIADLTGRTTYFLRYDAQQLPWPAGGSVTWGWDVVPELRRRFSRAREGAELAAEYLYRWLLRWTGSGRRVLVVGFSLGAYCAWLAIRRLPEPLRRRVDLVMMSGALVDDPSAWEGIEGVGTVVNAWSRDDLALKYAYPRVVGSDETPAAGLGPLSVGPLPNLVEVDVTDLVGVDHLWGSRNTVRMVRMCLACLWGLVPGPDVPLGARVVSDDLGHVEAPVTFIGSRKQDGGKATLSQDSISRLVRWTCVLPDLWLDLGRALGGDPDATRRMRDLDAWSLESSGRLSTLLDGGWMVTSTASVRFGPEIARRSRDVLAGLLRQWLSRSFAPGYAPSSSADGSTKSSGRFHAEEVGAGGVGVVGGAYRGVVGRRGPLFPDSSGGA